MIDINYEKTLNDYITSVINLSLESRTRFINCFKYQQFPKKHFLIRQDQVAHYLYFIIKGAAREFYDAEEKEITNWITCENEFVTSFASFISGKPSNQNIDLIEDSVLLSISRSDLYNLYDQDRDIERFARLVIEKHYCWLEEHTLFLKSTSAKEKYDNLVKFEPHMINRFPLGYIASYLGISQETVSRIRAGKLY